MDMMNQYKEETSQIHAPADLIQRTKQAVQEEERRIQQKCVQQTAQTAGGRQTTWDAGRQTADWRTMEKPERHDDSADRPRRRNYSKVYKWALPAAAAIFIVVLINASTMIIGRKFSASQSDTSMDLAAGMAGGAEESGAYDLAPVEVTEEAAQADTDGGIDKSFADSGFAEDSVAEAEESVAAADEEALDEMYDEGATVEAPAAAAEHDSVDSAENKSNISEGGAGELTIQEVEEKPEFCDNKNTRCIDSHGLQFYVAREWGNQWKAYVCIDETGYVITGSGQGIADREAFAQKAYELLTETVDGIE